MKESDLYDWLLISGALVVMFVIGVWVAAQMTA